MRIFLHRIIYLGALCGFVAFAVNYTGWFSYYLLWVAMLLPLLSLLLTIPACLKTKLSLSFPMSTERDAKATMTVSTVRCAALFPLPVYFTVTQENCTSCSSRRRQMRCWFIPFLPDRTPVQTPSPGASAEIDFMEDPSQPMESGKRTADARRTAQITRTPAVRIPIDTAHVAMIRTTISHVHMRDPLGLFVLPVRLMCEKEALTLVMPKPEKPDVVPERWKHETSILIPAKGFTEQTEIRDYRPGDPMRAVHWKLSAKTDGVLVREPVEHPRQTVGMSFDRTPDDASADRIFANLFYLLEALCRDDGTRCITVVWRDEHNADASAEIRIREDIPELFAHICAGGTPKTPVTMEDMKSSALLARLSTGYHISADGSIRTVSGSGKHYSTDEEEIRAAL